MITKRRLIRALISRISRFSILIYNYFITNKNLRCIACDKTTVSFSVFEGRPFGCPYCKSSSRERFVLEAIHNKLLDVNHSGKKIIHVAPGELAIARLFQKHGNYHAIDIQPGNYCGVPIEKADLTKIDSNEKYQDIGLLYASHVLEHIPDDLKAMNAIYKSLKTGGEAWFMVPLHDKETLEGKKSDTSKIREELYGQWDHVRQYGMDIVQKLESTGFSVNQISIDDLPNETVANSGLNPEDRIFICTKQ